MVTVGIISAITTLIPILLGIVNWKYIKWPLRVIVSYSIFSLICDYFGISLASKGKSNVLVTVVFVQGHMILLWYYFLHILDLKNYRQTPFWAYIFTILAFFVYIFVLNNSNNYVIAFRLLGIISLITIIFCILYFIKALRQLHVPRIEMDPNFWIVSGILLHLTSCFVLALTPDILSMQSFSQLWMYFKNLMQGLMNVLVSIGIYIAIIQSR